MDKIRRIGITALLIECFQRNPVKFVGLYQEHCRFYWDEQPHRELAGDY